MKGLYNLCSESKGAAELHSYHAADLCVCFQIYKKQFFSKVAQLNFIIGLIFQVILDTFHIPHLLVRRMLRDSVRKYGITEFPSLYLITRDGTFNRIAK